MRRSKKLIIVAVLAAVVLAGSIGGVVLAVDNEDNSEPGVRCWALMDRVCEIYAQNTGVAIDSEALEGAFTQARNELRPEGMPNRGEIDPEALQNHLQDLFDQGKITEEQYKNMKERMESMPDNLPGFGFRGHGGFRGFGGPCLPSNGQ